MVISVCLLPGIGIEYTPIQCVLYLCAIMNPSEEVTNNYFSDQK